MEADQSGQIFHVIGNILTGMEFQTKPAKRPDDSQSYVPGSLKFIGRIQNSDMSKLEQACRAVAPPGAQLRLNGTRKDPSKPIRRCGEWVHEVKEKVLSEGLVTA